MKSAFRRFPIIFIALWALIGCTQIDEKSYLEKANSLFQEDKYWEANQHLDQILNQNNDNFGARYLRSKCNFFLHRKEEMLSDLWTLIGNSNTTCPEYVLAANDLYNYHDNRLANDSCIKYCLLMRERTDKCTHDGPSKADVMWFLVTIYGRMEKYDSALQYADSITYFGGKPYYKFESKAWTYELMGKWEDAINQYTQMIDSFQLDSNILKNDYLSRAYLYQTTNQNSLACADWQKAFELGNESAKAKLDSFCLKK